MLHTRARDAANTFPVENSNTGHATGRLQKTLYAQVECMHDSANFPREEREEACIGIAQRRCTFI